MVMGKVSIVMERKAKMAITKRAGDSPPMGPFTGRQQGISPLVVRLHHT
jgi:hypothetical protein